MPEQALLDDTNHRTDLRDDARRQLDFFAKSLRSDGGFDTLNWDGTPMRRGAQELHTTTRLVHSYALGHAYGYAGSAQIIDAGMQYLWKRHRDERHGGYVWSVTEKDTADGTKLAYGHVFVLLAGASAKQAGHPDADRLIDDITDILDRHFWDDDRGLFKEEYLSDWTPFSTYRGMNANMHGVEALLAAFEATGREVYLDRAGRILDFFIGQIAPNHGWRIPEHYTQDWQVDPAYSGNPMFRPAGSTPGHSFELGRLLIQHWDLLGRPKNGALGKGRILIETALSDAWLQGGGFCYTLNLDGTPDVTDRYWWPVTEAIGALAVLLRLDPKPSDEEWYRKIWQFAQTYLIDADRGGWYPELAPEGHPQEAQFHGKPDIYHSLQAVLFALVSPPSRMFEGISNGTEVLSASV